jgi:lysophospholipase III
MNPERFDCLADNIKLHYDNETRLTYNSPGVRTRIPGFGSAEVVEYLDPGRVNLLIWLTFDF